MCVPAACRACMCAFGTPCAQTTHSWGWAWVASPARQRPRIHTHHGQGSFLPASSTAYSLRREGPGSCYTGDPESCCLRGPQPLTSPPGLRLERSYGFFSLLETGDPRAHFSSPQALRAKNGRGLIMTSYCGWLVTKALFTPAGLPRACQCPPCRAELLP